ncbi:prenyltransferase/squalene oxidase repeat-containing protein [Micromonospora sp. WMMD710]|uniref:prenyltransferase/squalene oxidase repeat-containing protein n=1 Tax=Micromonospora sp. WMMD710 TaxID=3016085 RepID=UPI0024168F6F|nr:prenyltransferase/squalene oxidase repeat-containing protein [Micromonospora sp. WMMD710]MDG4757097.1 prenyltransferase/squalene oxidase repeat-containing protein [Micromonospora sp. WMMD710]
MSDRVLAEPATDAARELIAGLALRPWGQVAPSVYETGRLVADAPWLAGHDQRIAFLRRGQRRDGAWGPTEGYALVPTLSATDALLSVVADGAAGTDLIAPVADALGALTGTLLATHARTLPDTPALDLIVPALVESINARLAGLGRATAERLPRPPLALPAGLGPDRLRAVRSAVAAGAALPPKLAHFYEVLGAVPADAGPDVTAVGASPAATAAWLTAAGPDASPAAHAFLRQLIRDGGGPVPCPAPITVFERAWVLSGLGRAGVAVNPPVVVLQTLAGASGAEGIATGDGLPTDADTTSVALDALARIGRPADPGSLWAYETADGFCTWRGEDGFSVTTNAHVLDAFGQHLAAHPDADARYRRAVDRLSAVLPGHQLADGSWQDRWHASAYYATSCCVQALAEFGRGATAAEAVQRAARWVLDSQRADGSWGRWAGTAEETAYALQVLLTASRTLPAVADAVARGHAYLHEPSTREHPPLWYGKELYCPTAIVRAAVLAACRSAAIRLGDVDRSVVDCGYQATKTTT